MSDLVAMARRSGRAPIAQSRAANGSLTAVMRRLQKVLQPAHARISDPRAARGHGRRRAAAAQRAEAARLARAPPAGRESRRLDRSDHRFALGGAAAADGGDVSTELRVPAPEA